jgi:hypothetical protein
LNANAALSSRFITIEDFAAEREREQEEEIAGLTTPTFFNDENVFCPFFQTSGDDGGMAIFLLRATQKDFDLSSSTWEEKDEAPPAKLDANESIHNRGGFFFQKRVD